MSGFVGVIALVAGVGVVVFAADLFVDGFLGVALALGIAPFVLSVALSGFEPRTWRLGSPRTRRACPAQRPARSSVASPSWPLEWRASAG
ncbi:MAG: hypothetical protein JO243_09105 [Solirubrobacterales bacterium]|nr:hypothetical protein [Solirubrobacterales bacterium]